MPSERKDAPITWGDLDADLQQLVQTEKALRFFATAYLVDMAGMLDANTKTKLDRVTQELGHPWQQDVEEQNGLTPASVRNLYAVLLDQYLPHEAIAFILRGLGYAFPEPFLEELLSGELVNETLLDQRTCLRIRRDQLRQFDGRPSDGLPNK